mmetsp:Transcript_25824/g.54579  ORF Transcript_25824/g.54579 Transcript_25824/m.54579 type:complete len:1046 (+) Transcript_25824:34-3171(+)
MASSSHSSSDEQKKTTPILDECNRLQTIQSFLTELWAHEVSLYETSPVIGGGGGGGAFAFATSGNNDHHETRNRPNAGGTVENATLFPYHTSLYPLLDCYDSIRDYENFVGYSLHDAVRPSPAPLPFDFNGHRRSLYGPPRLDRHGLRIEELATLEGHLPNSAWAIRQSLMPRDRKAQFAEYELSPRGASKDGSGGDSSGEQELMQQHQQQHQDPNDGDNILDEGTRHNDNRFWNILMDPVAEAAIEGVDSDVSLPPDNEHWVNADQLDDDDDDDENGNNDDQWEDIDEEEDGQEQASGNLSKVATNGRFARDFAFLKWWQRSIVNEREGAIDTTARCTQIATKVAPTEISARDYSPESLYENNSRSYATLILLKVLKHSLSDLQREFRLARAVVLLIADWRLCSIGETMQDTVDEDGGIECLRRLLTVISSEYVESCGGYCHEWYISNGGVSDHEDEFEDALEDSAVLDKPNHYCSDWWEFLGSVSTLLAYGITYMTRQHANVICAFVATEINRASSAASPTDGTDSNGEVRSGKAYLKQNLYFLNNADSDGGLPQDGAGCQIRTNLLLTILSALRQHAASDRMRLVKLLEKDQEQCDGDVSIQISKSLNSFQACVEIMIDIGERCLLRLPTNIQSRSICGMIVRGLVESYVGSKDFSPRAQKPLSYLAPEGTGFKLRSLIDPLRYADALANASSNPLLDPIHGNGNSRASGDPLEQLIGLQPPKDVQDVVRGLFIRDLVDIQVSGCGYGDFLLWCHLPISPEPLLVDYISNFPSNSLNDGAPQNNHWVIDEEGDELDYGHLSARYDFSLVVFIRQWHSPWTPESHLSFSIPYRRAVSTLALCAHRYGVPADISAHVNSFLPRSWWPDDRRQCWCRDCQLQKLKKDYHSKISSRQTNWDPQEEQSSTLHLKSERGAKSPTLITCPGCHLAMACSNDHMKYLHQDGHKRYCGLPPFRAPFSDEDNNLCRAILGEKEDTSLLENGDNENSSLHEGENSDDDDWESVNSSEELGGAVRSKSDMIFSFFNDKSYKHQRREAPPFANFF